jgi:hypothetical protein
MAEVERALDDYVLAVTNRHRLLPRLLTSLDHFRERDPFISP